MPQRAPQKLSQKNIHRAEGALATTAAVAAAIGLYAAIHADKDSSPKADSRPTVQATYGAVPPNRSAKPTLPTVKPESILVPQKKELRLIANKAASTVLNSLDLPNSGTTKMYETTGITYIGNKAALIDPATNSTRIGENRPEMRAVYDPATKEIGILATGGNTLTSGPRSGQEQFESVETIFKVGPQARIAKTSGELTTDDFRAAIADTKNVTLQGLEVENQWGFDNAKKQEFGIHQSIAVANSGELIKDTPLDDELVNMQPIGDPIKTSAELNRYIQSMNAVAEAAEQGIAQDLR
jgi:hypothetical protein